MGTVVLRGRTFYHRSVKAPWIVWFAKKTWFRTNSEIFWKNSRQNMKLCTDEMAEVVRLSITETVDS